ncbi:MAG: hypothetical protein Q8Q89_00590 [bacterium]|nr:hypothetical protein [bacterium]
MKRQNIYYLVSGIILLILIVGGFYIYKFRKCLNKVSYTPSREQGEITGSGRSSGLRRISGNPDKGDYYSFDFGLHKFKTSDDAIRSCVWK